MADNLIDVVALIDRLPIDLLPLKRFAAIYDIPPGTLYSYISRRQLRQGEHYRRDENGHIHISISGWEKWITGADIDCTPAQSAPSTIIKPPRRIRQAINRTGGVPELV